MKSEVYKRKVIHEKNCSSAFWMLLAARIKKCEDQLRRKKRRLRPRVAKCIEVYGGSSKWFPSLEFLQSLNTWNFITFYYGNRECFLDLKYSLAASSVYQIHCQTRQSQLKIK